MKPIDVFWTGGWDSTYRVLMLGLVEKVQVQPHYLVDPGRKSTRFELRAMERIRESAIARGATIDDPKIHNVRSVVLSDSAKQKHAELVRRFNVGEQYLWLSSYARNEGIEDIELCIHVDDKAYSVVQSLRAREHESALVEAAETLFQAFSFPVLEVSKQRMKEIAIHHSFDDLMALTWFCHLPTTMGKPCGLCNPCTWTAEEGLEDRLPRSANMRNFMVRRVIWRIPGKFIRKSMIKLLRALG